MNCPKCGKENPGNVVRCVHCKTTLHSLNASLATRMFDGLEDDAPPSRERNGTKTLTPSHAVRIQMENREPFTVYPNPEIILGRNDPISGAMPDVDLTPYGGLHKGISRYHASLQIREDKLYLLDLGSRNGTFLNGQRLVANRPYLVHSGDEVCLGRIVMHIHLD